MSFSFEDVLAGPIVRRVEPGLAAVWIALRRPARVELRLYEGPAEGRSWGTGQGADTAIAHGRVDSIAIGKELHLALARVVLAGEAGRLASDRLYAYDIVLRARGAEDGPGQGLRDLGLLAAGTRNGNAHLPLGYAEGRLPGFILPPTDIGRLKLLAGSCRKPHNPGADSMPGLDDLLSEDNAYLDLARRPHKLLLTGDQAYGDEIAPEYLALLNRAGQRLLAGDGGKAESIPFDDKADGQDVRMVPLREEIFPPARRQRLIRRQAGLTSGAGGSHALGFGEFASLYLMGWSNVLWPARWAEDALAERWRRVQAFKAAWQALHDQFEEADGLTDRQKRTAEAKLEYVHAAKLLPPAWRRMDAYLDPEDRRSDWGAHPKIDDVGAFPIATPPDTLDGVPDGRPALPGDDAAALGRAIARALTPSWFAGRQELGFDFKGRELFHDRALANIRALQDYHQGLARVRRLLANVPTYMTFDDHEVTDDWNITGAWVEQVNRLPLGRTVLRNGLLAFGLFQASGNDPLYFQPEPDAPATPGAEMLAQAQRLFLDAAGEFPDVAPDPAGTPVQRLDRIFNLGQAPATPVGERVRWHWHVGGPGYEVLSLDTRTLRGYPTPNGPAELATPEAIAAQIPRDPQYSYGTPGEGAGVAFVIAAAPVLGFPPIESIAQPVVNTLDRIKKGPTGPLAQVHADYFAGALDHDPEPWSYQEHIFEALLERLSRYRRVVFISGDVHYACSLKLDYWRYDPTQAAAPPAHARFVQVTASAFKNQASREAVVVLQSGLVGQLVQLLGPPRERIGYQAIGREPPLIPPAGIDFNRVVERQNQSDLALIPVAALPVGTTQRYAPAFAWRQAMVRDSRADDVRLAALQDVPALPTEGTGRDFALDVAARHFWQTLNAPSRVVTFLPAAGLLGVTVAQGRPAGLAFAALHALRTEPAGKLRRLTVFEVPLSAEGGQPPAIPDAPQDAAVLAALDA